MDSIIQCLKILMWYKGQIGGCQRWRMGVGGSVGKMGERGQKVQISS